MTDVDPTPRGIAKQQARAAAQAAYENWKHRMPDHQHLWSDSEPELFTRGLVRCRICMLTMPRSMVQLDEPPPCPHCGSTNHMAPTCPQKATT